MSPLQLAARAYRDAGFYPIRIAANGKIPIDTGWTTARPDIDQEAAMFANHTGNIGLTFPPDLCALDLDRKNDNDGVAMVAALEVNLGPLPPTLTATTPSNGEHRVYRLPQGVRLQNGVGVAPGVDVRSAGGQIVAAPSTINGCPYKWVNWGTPIANLPPNWILYLTKANPPATTPTKLASGDADIIPEGQRNDTLFRKAASLRANGFNKDEIEIALHQMNARACVPPLDASEVTAIATSASKYPPNRETWQVFGGAGIKSGAPPVPPPTEETPPWNLPNPITPEELASARPTPPCIVENLLFADVATLIAPGGMGKTTFELFQVIHVVLGLPLLGHKVIKPGPVLILTAEDSREILVARLRLIMDAMELSDADRRRAINLICISDVSGSGFRLTHVVEQIVLPSDKIDQLIEGCRVLRPVLVVIDPAVSFSIGETRVNDSEQGLVEAARRLRNALGCCVQYIHHTGKENARNKTVDQYSGRGGSAFADGSRMVHVLQSVPADEWRDATGEDLGPNETGLILARPKMSYCPPPGDILIRRNGYLFTRVEPVTTGKVIALQRSADLLFNLIANELKSGHLHTRNTLEAMKACDLSRPKIRNAVDWLISTGRLEDRPRPNAGAQGAKKYLHPLASPESVGEADHK